MKKVLIIVLIVVVLIGVVLGYLFIPYNTLTFGDLAGDINDIAGIGFMVTDSKAVVLDNKEDIERILNDLKGQKFKKVYTTQEQPQNKGNPILMIKFTEESKKWDINIYNEFNRFPGYNLVKLNRFFNDFYVVSEKVAMNTIINKYVSELLGEGDENLAYFEFSYNDFLTTMKQNNQFVSKSITSTNSPLSTDINRVDFGNGNIVSVYEYDSRDILENDLALINLDGSIQGANPPSDTSHFFKRGRILVNYIGNDQAFLDIISSILVEEFASPMIAEQAANEQAAASSSLTISNSLSK